MKKILIIMSFLLYCCGKESLKKVDCSYQNDIETLGVGLLLWENNCDKIVFYQDSLFHKSILKFDFCTGNIPICPLFYKPDYGIMYFVVKDKTDNFYKIIYDTNNVAFLPKNNIFRYVSWEKFLTEEIAGVRKIGKSDIYSVLSVKGDYILIEDMNTGERENFKWKDKDKLMIEIMLLM